jgi:hypothetical protein
VRKVKPGQFVIGSFFATDNTCEICRVGYQSSCVHREPTGTLGAQTERLRVPLADGTLVATPETPSEDLIPSYPAVSDIDLIRNREVNPGKVCDLTLSRPGRQSVQGNGRTLRHQDAIARVSVTPIHGQESPTTRSHAWDSPKQFRARPGTASGGSCSRR